jgi:NADH-quinone oxidoreductase subunit D
MLKDRYLADLPIVLAAIDPCFSCTDRLIAVDDVGRRESGSMTWEQVRLYGIAWYRGRGVDFSELNSRLAAREMT